jgi:hypothetical protein
MLSIRFPAEILADPGARKISPYIEEVSMRRVGVVSLLMLLALFAFFGCKETGSEAKTTGVEIHFDSCFTFAAWIWVDNNYEGTFTDEQPALLELPAGSHDLFVRSNMFVDQSSDTVFCWRQSFDVTQNEVKILRLNCHGHRCEANTGGGGTEVQ